MNPSPHRSVDVALIAFVLGLAITTAIAFLAGFRAGGIALAVVLFGAAVVRGVPTTASAAFAVRARWFDVIALLVLAVGVAFFAVTLPA
ncbi:DUF3017 domain-containing protein [Spelaeicoccus albus]|uniref:DUF3017 domain-containing protein n=1 Tax=Spelaeicoccus albus TaxID=1280376 RepID=A0A7Z0D5M4_9MICO|nr:DUF3017 domain-containing protein [Spelaeicoccus albus]NYI69166.1 hypothetical protein [Spelaeicoccus albus]